MYCILPLFASVAKAQETHRFPCTLPAVYSRNKLASHMSTQLKAFRSPHGVDFVTLSQGVPLDQLNIVRYSRTCHLRVAICKEIAFLEKAIRI